MTTRNRHFVPETLSRKRELKRYPRRVRKAQILHLLGFMPYGTCYAIARAMGLARSQYIRRILHELVADGKVLRVVGTHWNGRPKHYFVLEKHQPRLL